MDIERQLDAIWNRCLENKNDFKEEVHDVLFDGRKYIYPLPERKKILITGMNPSFNENNRETRQPYTFSTAKHAYFTTLRNVVGSTDAAYIDLFYFRVTEQSFLRALFASRENGLRFLGEQLQLTQTIIEEEIQPQLIIVFNKTSWGFWGKNTETVWMGYLFKEKDISGLKEGCVCEIVGLQNSAARVAPNIRSTRLKGTLVYFSRHLNRTSQEFKKRVEADILLLKKIIS